MTEIRPSLMVADLQIYGNLILAPMDGYTDWPFRSICRELGSAISYTEFVKAEDVLERPQYIQDKLHFTEAERPVFMQLYGHDPDAILRAGLKLQELGPDAIDINLGCPNRSIVSRGAGAGLLRTPKKVARIMKLLTSALEIPVTAKIRLGWKDCQKQLLVSRIIEEYGGALLAVHAKTKDQGHQGEPDFEGLAEIKSSLSIPVIGNGGVQSLDDIQAMSLSSGCDGVMIGRGAVKNPWIFSGRDRELIPPEEVKELLLKHLERSQSFYGTQDGLVLFRKFAAGYLEPYQLGEESRKSLLTETNPDKFTSGIQDVFNNLP